MSMYSSRVGPMGEAVLIAENPDDVLDFHDLKPIVRIDGALPFVWDWEHDGEHGQYRPLREGDRVTLAHQQGLPDSVYGGPPSGTIAFATATVANIQQIVYAAWYVTVENVEEL